MFLKISVWEISNIPLNLYFSRISPFNTVLEIYYQGRCFSKTFKTACIVINMTKPKFSCDTYFHNTLWWYQYNYDDIWPWHQWDKKLEFSIYQHLFMIVYNIYRYIHVGERQKHVLTLDIYSHDKSLCYQWQYGNTWPHALHFQNADHEKCQKLESGFSVNQLPYVADWKYLIVCFERVKYR